MPPRLGERALTNAERKRRYRDRQRGGPPLSFAETGRLVQQRLRARVAEERGPLFQRMAAEAVGGVVLPDLTVLTAANDPYRLDTPACRVAGGWVADQMARLVPGDEKVHLRGLHYRLMATGKVLKPNGEIYRNTDADYTWLGEYAAKAARWLEFVPFDRIVDEKNEPPEILTLDGEPFRHTWLAPGLGVELPEPDDLMPYLNYGTAIRQPYRIILIGEKSSLRPVLLPFAEQVAGELLLPSGELSDTMIYDMAERAAADDRPAVVLYFSDFDPAGYNMPTVVARKLQALRDLKFPNLDISVHPVALTYKQVIDLDLPSTPLKAGELRADGWRERWGREQTEIDALAALQPEVLRRLAADAIAPFFDTSLAGRTEMARRSWLIAASSVLEADPRYAEAAEMVSAAYDELEQAATALNDAQDEAFASLSEIELPALEPPEPEMSAEPPEPLFDSNDDWVAATHRLIEHRRLGADDT